ncbi:MULTISPECIES: DUF5325 family protein [Alteribacter]|uniref:Uncharacterized protein n=1 Tax=Alteribacter keqinensis TaxID=2483800 RepID=A0A3M7TYB0_9BACI|nr:MULTISPECIES: DUF5325 family protein [Alteribacter]MBM7095966.1 DUF5325 family protein [Alteribacter salitolerans]RNA69784.1 hypothetical protein EBO34_07570 [Alteribacter keqinensis]
MKTFNWPLFILSVFAACGIAGVGIGLAESSILIILISVVVTIAAVGGGFSIRKKILAED